MVAIRLETVAGGAQGPRNPDNPGQDFVLGFHPRWKGKTAAITLLLA
jgi:hypothetical protein